MAVMPAVTAVLLHYIAMDIGIEFIVFNTG